MWLKLEAGVVSLFAEEKLDRILILGHTYINFHTKAIKYHKESESHTYNLNVMPTISLNVCRKISIPFDDKKVLWSFIIIKSIRYEN